MMLTDFWGETSKWLYDMVLGPRGPRRKGMGRTMLGQHAAEIRASDYPAPVKAVPLPPPDGENAAPDLWPQEQRIRDRDRNWQMDAPRRDAYLAALEWYYRERPSRSEWEAFDPAPQPEPAAPPPWEDRTLWRVHGRPDASPMPEAKQNAPVVPPSEFERAFPGFTFIPGPRPRNRNDHWWGTVGAEWREDYLVEIPNRWGIRHPQRGITQTILCNREVAPHLIAALDELDRRGLLYLIRTMDSFAPRYQQDWRTLSSHAVAISLDINQQDFPQLSRRRRDELQARGQPLPQQDERLIAIMQKHGFTYGGYWEGGSYDPMHFEFSDRRALGL